MNTAMRVWWRHLRALCTGTLHVWWRSLPLVLVALTLGFLGYNAALVAAASISDRHAWTAVALLAVGFASLLVGYLGALQVIGRELSIGDQILQARQGESLVSEPLTRLVAMTLLPFLGIYAVFGELQKTSGQLVTYEVVTRGMWERGVLATLNPRTAHQMVVVVAVLAIAYVVRRVLDLLHERTGRRVLGIATGLVETFFMLVLIFGGSSVIVRTKDWLLDRQAAAWLRGWGHQAAELLRHVSINVPAAIGWVWHALVGPVWSWTSEGIMEPLLWLALAALAFGSRTLSVAEFWRETVGDRPTRLRAVERIGEQEALARFGAEVKELFFGDVDDKYLPTLQSLRLVLGAGISLVGVFALLHAATMALRALVEAFVRWLVGPASSREWIALATPLDLVTVLVVEPLRLCLLAVTYRRCLQVITARSEGHDVDDLPAPAPLPDDRLSNAPTITGLRLRQRVRSQWPDMLLAASGLVVAGMVTAWSAIPVDRRLDEVPRGQEGVISVTNQSVRVADVAVVRAVRTSKQGEAMKTTDAFIAVRIVLRSPGERAMNSVRCELHSPRPDDPGSRTVLKPAIINPLSLPDPGFQVQRDLLFERPREGVKGSRLHCWAVDFIRTYQAEVDLDLAIDDTTMATLDKPDAVLTLELPEPEVIR